MIIPDYVAPIVGYRLWKWEGGGSSLLSLVKENPWPTGRALEAKCNQKYEQPDGIARRREFLRRLNEAPHQAPQIDCTCGIYAHKTAEQLREVHPWTTIAGEVYLWGTVVEHRFGWRAEFAYPKKFLLDPHSYPWLGLLAACDSLEVLQSCLGPLTAYGSDLWLVDNGKIGEAMAFWTARSGFLAPALERLQKAFIESHQGIDPDMLAKAYRLYGAERHVLVKRLTLREIEQRGISQIAVKKHIARIFDKLGISNLVQILSLLVSSPKQSKPN